MVQQADTDAAEQQELARVLGSARFRRSVELLGTRRVAAALGIDNLEDSSPPRGIESVSAGSMGFRPARPAFSAGGTTTTAIAFAGSPVAIARGDTNDANQTVLTPSSR